MEAIAARVRRRFGVSTSIGFGPRYLHSTGQFFKAGPPTGSFLVLTHEGGADVHLAERDYDLQTLVSAQARGDFEVLAEEGRSILMVHLGKSISDGLTLLELALDASLA